MTKEAYKALDHIRREFRGLVTRLEAENPGLPALQEKLRIERGYDDYQIETSVVYNRALDGLGPKDDFSFILVADNPGKKEQLAINNRYLVGQSGKLAEGFFRQRLYVDFRRDVIILNKSPLHTPKTAELRRLLSLADETGEKEGQRLRLSFADSQRTMAALAHELHAASSSVLWLSGLGEFGPKGLFRSYADALGKAYLDEPQALRDRIWLFRHFSMNQFAIEVKRDADPAKPLMEELERIGVANRKRVLGW